MMFIHHFFTFPHWWIGNTYFPYWAKYASYLNEPFKMCVPVFCFLTGYFYWHASRKTLAYSLKKIGKFLGEYWICYFILGLLAVLICKYQYSAHEVVLELFGVKTNTMVFCWYVYVYCAIMVALPFITFDEKRGVGFLTLKIGVWLLCLQIVLLLPISSGFQRVVREIGIWSMVSFVGYICARYGLFHMFDRLMKKWIPSCGGQIVVLGVMFVFAMAGRKMAPNIQFWVMQNEILIPLDIIYAPFFVYALVCLTRFSRFKIGNSILGELGEQSMRMWFFSCAFFGITNQVLQPILYWSGCSLVVLIWGLILCYIPSKMLAKILSVIKVGGRHDR